MRLVRFESEIGINFAIGVLRVKLYANSVSMYGCEMIEMCHVSKGEILKRD